MSGLQERLARPELLTIDEVANVLNVSRRTVYRMCDAGQLEPIKISGRATRFSPDAIRTFLGLDGDPS